MRLRDLSWVGLLMVGVVLTAGCGPKAGDPSGTSTAAGGREFNIQGMSCEGCAESITACLKKIPGVESAKVSLADKKAVVVADPAQVPAEKIVAAVKEAGYEATAATKR